MFEDQKSDGEGGMLENEGDVGGSLWPKTEDRTVVAPCFMQPPSLQTLYTRNLYSVYDLNNS